jgi:transcriptional regulator with XRE-family HTH domain
VREEAGLSIRGLATSSGVSYSHIAAIERGEDGVSAPRLAMLAAALGCTIADLRKPDVAAHV